MVPSGLSWRGEGENFNRCWIFLSSYWPGFNSPPPSSHGQSELTDHKQMYCVYCVLCWVGLTWVYFIFFYDLIIELGLGYFFPLVKQLKMWLWIQNRHHTDSGRGCYLSSASRNNVHHLLHAFNSHIYNFCLMLNYRSHTKTLSSSGKHPLRSYGHSCYKCKCWIKTTVQLFDLLNNLNILTSVMRLFFFIFLGRFSLEI